MALLNYSAFASLDGYIADEQGDFSWAMPSPEAHTLANELMEPIGTCIYGRRMYEMMTYWDSPEATAEGSGIEYDFAMTWRAADKIVYSRTLAEVATARTRLEREFRSDDILKLKAEATADIEIGGPTIAAAALHAGLVDQFALFIVPVVIGGGIPAFPPGLKQAWELMDERRFADGMVYLRYRSKD